MLALLLRRFRASATARALAARTLAAYLRFCRATGRWEVMGEAHRALAQSGRGQLILAIWHGRLAMVPTEMAGRLDVRAFVSLNRDGDLIARILDRFGIGTLRGSTHDPAKPGRERGGRAAFLGALAAFGAERNLIVALTPDGPRGPRMRCHPGVATLTARTGVSVLPWTFSVRRGVVARSWDRFLVPLPFSRGVIAYGPPIPPPEGTGAEALARHGAAIEAALTALTREADARTGRATPEPEPAA